MYIRSVFISLLLCICCILFKCNAEEEQFDQQIEQAHYHDNNEPMLIKRDGSDDDDDDDDAAGDATQSIGSDIASDSSRLFTGEPVSVNLTDTLEFQFLCELDDIFCKKVLNSTLSAGNSLAQVINLKTKIV
jgi:hypothetical protein